MKANLSIYLNKQQTERLKKQILLNNRPTPVVKKICYFCDSFEKTSY